MAGFDDREKGFEAKYRLDEETRFRVRARRNKLLGLWLAKAFGLTGEAADGYAKEVVAADLERPGDDDVIEKVMADIRTRGRCHRRKGDRQGTGGARRDGAPSGHGGEEAAIASAAERAAKRGQLRTAHAVRRGGSQLQKEHPHEERIRRSRKGL